MEVTTVLGRVFKGSYQKDKGYFNILYLVIQPRHLIEVFQGNDLTEEQYDKLKENAAFITLQQPENMQLPVITNVIEPFLSTGYKRSV